MIRRFAVPICAVCLNACGNSDDVQAWIKETEQTARSRPTAGIPAIPSPAAYTGSVPAENAFDPSRLPEAFADNPADRTPDTATDMRTSPEQSGHTVAGWKYVGSIQSGKRFSALIEYRGRVYRTETGGTIGPARLLSARREQIVLQHGSSRIVLPLSRSDSFSDTPQPTRPETKQSAASDTPL